jgi:hypothetical protein
VSWILKWQYIFNQNCIARQFSVKWWDKFKFSVVQARLKTEFPEEKKTLEVQTAQAQAPEAQVQPTKSESPKSTSPSSSKGKKPAKKDFKAFALALAEKFYECNEEEEEEEEEEGSAGSSFPHEKEDTAEALIHRYGFDLFQNAQDPYDAVDLDSDS